MTSKTFVMTNSPTPLTSSRTYSVHATSEGAQVKDKHLRRPPRGMSVLHKILAGKYDFMAHHRKASDPEHEQLGGDVIRPEMKR